MIYKWLLNDLVKDRQLSMYMSAFIRKICKKCCFFFNKNNDLQQRFLNLSLKLELSVDEK